MFTDNPPENYGEASLPIVRTEPGKRLQVIHCAESWTGVLTHYWGGHTIMCKKDACEACDANQKPIWKGFIVATDLEKTKRVLIQITPLVTNPLRERARGPKGVFGQKVIYTRAGRRNNSPLQALVIGYDDDVPLYTKKRQEQIVARIFKARNILIPEVFNLDGGPSVA